MIPMPLIRILTIWLRECSGFGFVDEDRIVCVNANNPETAENNRELKQNAYDVGRMLANLGK